MPNKKGIDFYALEYSSKNFEKCRDILVTLNSEGYLVKFTPMGTMRSSVRSEYVHSFFGCTIYSLDKMFLMVSSEKESLEKLKSRFRIRPKIKKADFNYLSGKHSDFHVRSPKETEKYQKRFDEMRDFYDQWK